jgi:hypothetical protein
MSTRSRKLMFVGSKMLPVRRTGKLAAIYDPNVYNVWIPNISQPYRPPRPVTVMTLLFTSQIGNSLTMFSTILPEHITNNCVKRFAEYVEKSISDLIQCCESMRLIFLATQQLFLQYFMSNFNSISETIYGTRGNSS